MIKRWILPVIFLIGLVMTVYPWVNRSIAEYQQNKLLTQWEMTMEVDSGDSGEQQEEQGGQPREQVRPIDIAAHEPGEAELEAVHEQPDTIKGRRVLGTITIPTIEAYEPILEDTSAKSLKIGIGTVVAGRNAGEIGNLVLAGHRSWTYGKQFSRLDELDMDDEIQLQSIDGNYTYVVTDKFLVEPDGVEVLEQSEDKSILTLITCHPMKNPTHRLIVKAELKI